MPRVPRALRLLPLLLAVGCKERLSTPGERANAVPSTSSAHAAGDASLYSKGALERVSSEIRHRIGERVSVLELELTQNSATIQVEAPTRPGNVVQYEWDGRELHGPVPVELRGSGVLETNLFPLSTVELEQIPELVKTAVERVDKEHGRVERLVVRRNLPVDEAVGIRVYVESPIRSSHVDADARGRIAEWPRLP